MSKYIYYWIRSNQVKIYQLRNCILNFVIPTGRLKVRSVTDRMHCVIFDANNHMRFCACIIFDAIICFENTQHIQSERTLRSCLLVSAGRSFRSKHANTRHGTRILLHTVPILGTRQKIGTQHTESSESSPTFLYPSCNMVRCNLVIDYARVTRLSLSEVLLILNLIFAPVQLFIDIWFSILKWVKSVCGFCNSRHSSYLLPFIVQI